MNTPAKIAAAAAGIVAFALQEYVYREIAYWEIEWNSRALCDISFRVLQSPLALIHPFRQIVWYPIRPIAIASIDQIPLGVQDIEVENDPPATARRK
jgi:hypothetical protein